MFPPGGITLFANFFHTHLAGKQLFVHVMPWFAVQFEMNNAFRIVYNYSGMRHERIIRSETTNART